MEETGWAWSSGVREAGGHSGRGLVGSGGHSGRGGGLRGTQWA